MIWFFLYLMVSFIIAVWANSWNRSPIGFLLLSMCFSPLLGGLVLLAIGEREDPESRRNCPKCSEMILKSATLCRFCGSDVEPIHQVKFKADGNYDLEPEGSRCNMCSERPLKGEQFCLEHIYLSPNAKKYH